LGEGGCSEPSPRIWLGGPLVHRRRDLDPLALHRRSTSPALIGPPIAEQLFGYDGHPSRIYVRADTSQVVGVADLLAPTANPEAPDEVSVSRPSDALAARVAVAGSSTTFFLGLGAIALIVGEIGIPTSWSSPCLNAGARSACAAHVPSLPSSKCLRLGRLCCLIRRGHGPIAQSRDPNALGKIPAKSSDSFLALCAVAR
jgi:hypothetical protein